MGKFKKFSVYMNYSSIPQFYLGKKLKRQTRIYKLTTQEPGCIFAQSGIGG